MRWLPGFAMLFAFFSSGATFQESALLALVGGLVSFLLAIVSALIAFFTARANFKREVQRIREQIHIQKEVERGEQITALKQRYLAPLRYHAHILGLRFEELRNKFMSPEEQRVRDWFKQIKDHVTQDRRRPDFAIWSCYEGVFSVGTIYYTCCYFQCARDLMAHVPFREIVPSFSVELEKQLARVGQAFVWDGGEAGIWAPLQEVIGDAFTTAQGSRMSYAEMCRDQDTGDAFRRAPYLRPLDFYWGQVKPQNAADISVVLKELVQFLDAHSPQAGEKLEPLLDQVS
jgi:hypothetical protein